MSDNEVLNPEDYKEVNRSKEIVVNGGSGKLYSVTEVAEMFDKSGQTIRYWEKGMKDLLEVSRSPQGARSFTEKDIALFREVNHWRDQGFTLDVIYKFLKSSKGLYGSGEKEVPSGFNTPSVDDRVLKEVERLIELLSKNSEVLLLGDGVSEEEKIKREKEDHVSRESAKRRVEAKLRSNALKEWVKEPENKRYVKSGLFRKEENINERDTFVEEYIAIHFEEEYKKEILGN